MGHLYSSRMGSNVKVRFVQGNGPEAIVRIDAKENQVN